MPLLTLHLKDGTTNPISFDQPRELEPFLDAWLGLVPVWWEFVGSANGVTTRHQLDDITRIEISRRP